MDVSKVSAVDWLRFARRYPNACDFLLAANLAGELASLEREVARESERATGNWTAWKAARLRELREWAGA